MQVKYFVVQDSVRFRCLCRSDIIMHCTAKTTSNKNEYVTIRYSVYSPINKYRYWSPKQKETYCSDPKLGASVPDPQIFLPDSI
jgi:hypothetical protein